MTGAATGLALRCRCGALTGRLDPARGSRLVCYCKDCRAYARHLGDDVANVVLDDHGGTALFQTTPDRITIDTGAEHLAALRLGPKGLLRWHTACCRTPVANTLFSPGLRFAGVPQSLIAEGKDRLGPVICLNAVDQADPPLGRKGYGVARAGAAVLLRHLRARLSGQGGGPFRDDGGRPVAEPRVLTLAERRAAEGAVP
ncbi:DUF6151 family protein [Anianabacter salinae]|uniref:DUF6151 family protein n=1 Tax=Anianabacter salinae TaxID=2851023 RepID=UPI00225DD0FC|nr:DUF6151 family protein [Anianabacter salinae]MBV0912807.1 hypothetical protein [Anianabacter salinae]